METSILTPKGLFGKDIRYTVPDFQRRYVWTQEDQWEPLWEDTRNIAENYLEKLEESNNKEILAEQKTSRHFLGAVVVQQVNTATRDIERREVIDGQQRLTTLQLLLDAIQYVCEYHTVKGVSKRLSKFVKNDEDLIKNNDEIFKLWPTTSDREAFRCTMHNDLTIDDHENSPIVQAHEYFRLQAQEWIGSSPELIQSRAEALETAVTKMLQIVVIDLESQDDPHIIFEILNARGTPLSESDLIKNYVTSKAGQSAQDDIWGDLDDDWWQEDVRQGRLIRSRIDALLDYWLEMHTLNDITAGRVFNVFKKVTGSKQIKNIMLDIKNDLSNYRRYEHKEGERAPVEKMFRYRAGVMQMGAFTPALLIILSKPDNARFESLKALESFLIRRMVCRYTTKDYNRLSLDLVRALNNYRPESADRAVIEFLRGQEAYSRRWPDDSDLEEALITIPLYRRLTRGRLRLILEGIEQQYRNDHFSEQTDLPKNLTIEHVLPQNWETHWPLPDDIDESEGKQTRNLLIHTIGNLTLISDRLNSAASNASWKNKRTTLEKHSTFFLNRVLLADSKDTNWDEQFIKNRSKKMAKIVAKVWPGPHSAAWDR